MIAGCWMMHFGNQSHEVKVDAPIIYYLLFIHAFIYLFFYFFSSSESNKYFNFF